MLTLHATHLGQGFTPFAGGGAGFSAPLLEPAAGWAGWTAWSAGNTGLDAIAPPAVDGALRGSGFTQPPMARHNGWNFRRITAAGGELILVGAYTADPSRNGVEKVVAYLEGGQAESTVPIYDAASKLWGYPFRVRAPAGKGGVARLVVDVFPWNGQVLRIPGPHGANGFPLILDTDPAIAFRTGRVVRYLDPVAPTDGDGSVGTPWKTFKKAMANSTSDMLVLCSDGDTNEILSSLSTGPNTHRAPVEFRGTGGVNSCRMSKAINTDEATGGVPRSSDDTGQVRMTCNLVKFTDIRFDLSKYISLFFNSANFTLTPSGIFERCKGVDSLSDLTPGALRVGPACGYYGDYVNFFAGGTTGANNVHWASIESEWSSLGTAGISYMLNDKVITSTDAALWNPWNLSGSPWMINTDITFAPLVELRYHHGYPASVASFAVQGTDIGTGANLRSVVITLVGAPTMGSMGYLSTPNAGGDFRCRFLSGPLSGQEFDVIAVDGTAKTVRVYDPTGSIAAALAAGHQFTAFSYIHPDTFQQAADVAAWMQGAPYEGRNIIVEGGLWRGYEFQAYLFNSSGFGGRGQLSTTGTAATITGCTRTIASVSFDGGTGRTTITWTVDATQPMPMVGASVLSRSRLRFLTGALAGQDFRIFSHTSGQNTTVIQAAADGGMTSVQAAALLANDTASPWQFAVGDAISFRTAGAGANQNQSRHIVTATGPNSFTLDEAFPVNASASTLWVVAKRTRDVAIVNNRSALSDAPSGAVLSAQFGTNLENFLYQNNTILQRLLLRNQTGTASAFAPKDWFVADNVFDTILSDVAFSTNPARGVTFDNNAILTASNPLGGTDNNTSVSATFDATLRPTGGLTKTKENSPRTGRPVIPFRADGTAAQSGDVVGAVQP